jgi:PadR family transcriptional regulator, regulatory protein PadR
MRGYSGFMVSPESALLRVLISGEGYGLELTGRVREWTNGKLMLDDQAFYDAVHVLEEQGLVESYMGEPSGQRGGQARRYYKLTAAGQRAALEVLTASLTGQM